MLAGAINRGLSGVVECTKFYQRDMDVRGLLDLKLGETPFDNINEIVNSEEGYSCGSGDSFVSKKIEMEVDLVDMEAYALAKVCKLEGIEFKCFKYISDNADDEGYNGYMNEDLYSLDIKRFQKFHSSKKFIMNRVTETLGDLYGMHWPYKQHKTSRDQKLLPYHDELKKAGACFGQSGEYERPMWFALDGTKPEYEYSFNYQNWYPSTEYESKNTIKNVGLFELSPFSKYEIKGDKAHEELQRLCTANIKNEIGKCTYTHMLNEGAGIETDLTVVLNNT